jgi:hypothetical protein
MLVLLSFAAQQAAAATQQAAPLASYCTNKSLDDKLS